MIKTDKTLTEKLIFDTMNKFLEKNNNKVSKESIDYIESIIKNKKIHILIHIIIDKIITEKSKIDDLDEIIFTKLIRLENDNIIKKLYQLFPKTLQAYKSSLAINYQNLQQLLIQQQFQEADKLTQVYLCQIANLKKKKQYLRQWLYFTDISLIPQYDLFIIDLLWQTYSSYKFGFSIQKKIWTNNQNNWNLFLEQIGWSEQGTLKRYPQEFMWNINAPKGHLPLFNQLRGNQVIYSLFNKIIW